MKTEAQKQAVRDRVKAWRLANPERKREANAKWAAANPEKVAASRKNWKAQNRDKYDAWVKANPDKMNAYSLAWAKRNKHVKAAQRSRRRAAELQATPQWADKEKIDEFFAIARAISDLYEEPFEVDHIIPLRNKYVCGLHVHTNLQVLHESDNRKKTNRFQVEFEQETRDLERAA